MFFAILTTLIVRQRWPKSGPGSWSWVLVLVLGIGWPCLGWPPSSHHVLLTYSPCLKGPCCRSYRTTQYTTTGDDGQGTVWNQGVRRSDVCSCIGALGGSIGPIVTVSQHSPLSRGSGLRDCSLFLTWHQALNTNKTTTSGLGRLGFYMDHRVTGSCWRDSWV